MRENHGRHSVVSAGTMLGIGLGGFIDGIVLHQLLQWHNMLSSKVPPVDLATAKYNMLWDGVFHSFTWIFTVVGLALLWRAGQNPRVPWSTRAFVGALALGWGLFNLVEGIVDHQILGVHHVHPGPAQLAWDIGFLIFGGLLCLGGWRLIRGRSGTQPHGGARAAPAQSPDLGHPTRA